MSLANPLSRDAVVKGFEQLGPSEVVDSNRCAEPGCSASRMYEVGSKWCPAHGFRKEEGK